MEAPERSLLFLVVGGAPLREAPVMGENGGADEVSGEFVLEGRLALVDGVTEGETKIAGEASEDLHGSDSAAFVAWQIDSNDGNSGVGVASRLGTLPS